jgi:molecular chaperone DnaK
MPQVEVTFDIDANGILNVTAADKATGRSQHITITASSGLSDSEVERMRKEAEAHADEDTKRKELIEVRNHADTTIYTAEKTLKDLGDKVPADLKRETEESVSTLRTILNGDDAEAIRKATDDLGQTIQKIGSAAYQAAGPQAGAQQAPGGPQAGPQGGAPGDQGPAGGDDVVDGEFKNV